jgi:hypothetical protein
MQPTSLPSRQLPPSHFARPLIDSKKRRTRWHIFQALFVMTYLGIVLDIITTGIGYLKAGSGYEQNPFGSLLITNLGWTGLLAVMTLLCLVCYTSFRVVFARVSVRWLRAVNAFMFLLTGVRWLAVITALMYIGHALA